MDCGVATVYPQAKRCNPCMGLAMRGEKSWRYKGGSLMKNGYVQLNIGRKHVLEHRYLWEQANGPIPTGSVIHHMNHNRSDNRLENLMLLTTGDHTRLHLKHNFCRLCEQPNCTRRYKARGCCDKHYQQLPRIS